MSSYTALRKGSGGVRVVYVKDRLVVGPKMTKPGGAPSTVPCVSLETIFGLLVFTD